MKTILVRERMSKPVMTIDSQAKLAEVHKLMHDKRIRRLPVVDNGKLVGIVTLLDTSEARPEGADKMRPMAMQAYIAMMHVSDVMTRNPITISPDASVVDVARLMAKHKISGLPVVENGAVVGIITESDTFRAILDVLE